jgi:hypothetical protein
MTSSPGPLVHPNGLGGWSGEDRRCPHQTQEGGRTGRQPQASREPGPCVPAEGDANRAEGCDEPRRFARVRGAHSGYAPRMTAPYSVDRMPSAPSPSVGGPQIPAQSSRP